MSIHAWRCSQQSWWCEKLESHNLAEQQSAVSGQQHEYSRHQRERSDWHLDSRYKWQWRHWTKSDVGYGVRRSKLIAKYESGASRSHLDELQQYVYIDCGYLRWHHMSEPPPRMSLL